MARQNAPRPWLLPAGVLITAALLLVLALALLSQPDVGSRKAAYEAAVKQLRARGEPLSMGELLARRPVPPAERNAALVLREAFELLRLMPTSPREGPLVALMLEGPPGSRHSLVLHRTVGQHLEELFGVLEAAREAARYAEGGYPVAGAENPLQRPRPHLGPLRRTGQLCATEALWRADAGRTDAAGSLCVLRRTAGSVGPTPFAERSSTRYGLTETFFRAAERCLGMVEFPPGELSLLRREIEQTLAARRMEPVIRGQRARAHYLLTAAGREQKADFARHTDAPPTYLGSAAAWEDGLEVLRVSNRLLDALRHPPRARVARVAQLHQRVKGLLEERPAERPLTRRFALHSIRLVEDDLWLMTRLEVARAALAAEQFRIARGRWPEGMEEMVPDFLEAVPKDPYSDAPFVYRAGGQGLLIYSVGPDGADDGGLSYENLRRRVGREVTITGGFDLPFRLLEPGRRGERGMEFREEILNTDLSRLELRAAGFGQQRLEELGLGEEVLRRLGYRQ